MARKTKDRNGLRPCSKCNQWLPSNEEFYYTKTNGQLFGHCKTCHKSRKPKSTGSLNVEAGLCRKGRHAYGGTGPCRECSMEADRRRYKSMTDEERKARNLTSRLWSRYSITLEQYEQLVQSAGDRCQVCGTGPDPKVGWSIDHDHSCCPDSARSCGKCIRGILCRKCNAAIGLLGDDPALVQQALAYLRGAP